MNNPQHACKSCNEFIGAVRELKHEVSEAKRLLTVAELQGFLNVLQVKLGGLETLAVEIKGFTTVAVAAAAVHEVSDVIPDRKMAAANARTLTLES